MVETATPRFARRRLVVDGRPVTVAVGGHGPPLVLASGLLLTDRLYVQNVSRLAAAGFRAIAVDVAGSGIADDGKGLDEYGRLLGRVLDELGVGPAILAGHSLGGRLAVELAATQPDRVTALLLVDASVGAPWDRLVRMLAYAPPFVGVLGAMLLADTLGTIPLARDLGQAGKLSRLAFPVLLSHLGAPWRLLGPGLSALYAAASVPLLDRIGRAGVPVTVLHGDCDLVVPPATALDAARRTGGELVVVHGATHSWLLQDPETLPAIIRELLDPPSRRARRPPAGPTTAGPGSPRPRPAPAATTRPPRPVRMPERPPVSEVTPGVFRLVLPLGIHGIPSVNGYLIADARAATLVDSGIWTGDRDGRGTRVLEDGLAASGFTLSQVRRLVITHAHIDHYGIAGEVVERTGAELWMHRLTRLDITKYRDPDAAVDRRQQMLGDHGLYGRQLERASTGLRDWMPVMPSIGEPSTWLEGGESFEADGRAWQVVHTPGHSPGHVCLWSPQERVLLSGDHLLPAISSPVTFERGFERDPMGSYLDSLQRVAALGPALVLPGHGDPFEDGARRAESVERGKRRRLGEVMRIIAEEPLPVTEIVGRLFRKRLVGAGQHFAMAEVLAHLAYYDVRGQAERVRGPDGVFSWRPTGTAGPGVAG